MLKKLKLSNVGPAAAMELEFGQRLNLITGDNGLGKSFLLDIAWWAITGNWPAEANPALTSGRQALPKDPTTAAYLGFTLMSDTLGHIHQGSFIRAEQSWQRSIQKAVKGLVFYVMPDGSFAVWDAARNALPMQQHTGHGMPSAYVFSPKQVWDGLQRDDGTWLCNGLIRDWASWQKEKGTAFEKLCAVLKALSPSEKEQFVPGELTRISLTDVRDMPTLKMPYGTSTPVVHASSGIKRIIALAYFLVWCWEEHQKARNLMGQEPDNQVLMLIDEVESHLHPKWQRSVIPALMSVIENLSMETQVQLIAVTHSPLVMASVEPTFDAEQDAWFDLDLDSNEVVLHQRTFIRHGDASRWLTSEAFDLGSARSLEAEKTLEQAARILSEEVIDAALAKALDAKLRTLLGDTDPFWIRWRYVGEKQGGLA